MRGLSKGLWGGAGGKSRTGWKERRAAGGEEEQEEVEGVVWWEDEWEDLKERLEAGGSYWSWWHERRVRNVEGSEVLVCIACGNN